MRKIIDPYQGNILIEPLGPMLSREEALARLTFIPPIPSDICDIPKHVRMHFLLQLLDLHLPSIEGARLVETADLIIRPSYRYRDPKLPATWSAISGESVSHKTPRAPAAASITEGHSGTGKTQAVLRALSCYPQQIVLHPSFPSMAKEHIQVAWLSADVPASGRATDLAVNLMQGLNAAIQRYLPGAPDVFEATLSRSTRDGSRMLDKWRQIALGHFLGILHLDEVQNFFRLQSLDARRKRRGSGEVPELAIIEDQCLKWLLTVTNTWQIGLMLSGTPDGVAALTKRLANAQRLATIGYHHFPHITSAKDPYFANVLMPTLLQFQYVKTRIADSSGLPELILELTAGIRRLIIALWIAAHRIAFERKTDDLRLDDFRKAAATYLSPVANAVQALRSGDLDRMSRYEDLIPRDSAFWSNFWESMKRQ